MFEEFKDKEVLITTHEWFVAPNGKRYGSIYGTFKGVFESEDGSEKLYVNIGNAVIAESQINCIIDDAASIFAIGYATKGIRGDLEYMSRIYNADEFAHLEEKK